MIKQPMPVVADYPICPWCKTEYTDPHDFELGDGDETEVDCDNCHGKFMAACSISVCYQSDPLDPPPEKPDE